MRRCGRARLGPVSPRRAPWRRMRDPNAPNPQDMQRPPSHCAKRGPGADVQAKAAPPARLRRSETVFQIKAYLKNNKTWRLGKAPARPDAAVEVGGADRGRERSRHGGGPHTKPSGAVPLGPHAPRSPGRSPHQPLTSPQLSGNAPVPTRVPRPGRPPCPCHHSHRAPRRPSMPWVLRQPPVLGPGRSPPESRQAPLPPAQAPPAVTGHPRTVAHVPARPRPSGSGSCEMRKAGPFV